MKIWRNSYWILQKKKKKKKKGKFNFNLSWIADEFEKTNKLNEKKIDFLKSLKFESNINLSLLNQTIIYRQDKETQTVVININDNLIPILIDYKIISSINDFVSIDNLQELTIKLSEDLKKSYEIIENLKNKNIEIKEEKEKQILLIEKNNKKIKSDLSEANSNYEVLLNEMKAKLVKQEILYKEKIEKIEIYFKSEIKQKEEEYQNLKNNFSNIKEDSNLKLEKIKKLEIYLEEKDKILDKYKRNELIIKSNQNQNQDIKRNVKKFNCDSESLFEKNIINLKEMEILFIKINSELKKLDKTFEKLNNIKNNLFKFEHEKIKIIDNINETIELIYNNINNLINANGSNKKQYLNSSKNLKYLFFEQPINLNIITDTDKKPINSSEFNISTNKKLEEESHNDLNKRKLSESLFFNSTNIEVLELKSKSIPIKKEREKIKTKNNSSHKFDNLINFYNIFFDQLNKFGNTIFFTLDKLNDSIKFSLDVSNLIKQKNELYSKETKNTNLELEVSKKSEYYLKNAFLIFQQNFINKLTETIPIYNFENIILQLNKISNNISDYNAPEVKEISNKIIESFKETIDEFIQDKNIEIKNLNEKILFFLKEIKNYKKIVLNNPNNNYFNQDSNDRRQNLINELIETKDKEIERLNEYLYMYADKYKKIKYTDNNIQIYKIDENKTNINNYSINLSDSMKDTSNILVNFYSNF